MADVLFQPPRPLHNLERLHVDRNFPRPRFLVRVHCRDLVNPYPSIYQVDGRLASSWGLKLGGDLVVRRGRVPCSARRNTNGGLIEINRGRVARWSTLDVLAEFLRRRE